MCSPDAYVLTYWRIGVLAYWRISVLVYRFADDCSRPKTKPPLAVKRRGVLRGKSLTMSYFHRRTSTIIGAKAFHCPVRDGKEWYHLAMVIRRSLLSG